MRTLFFLCIHTELIEFFFFIELMKPLPSFFPERDLVCRFPLSG